MLKVAIVMGSLSDYEIVKKCEETLKTFEVEYETKVISAHRTPEIAFDFAKAAEQNGYGVIIAAAGKSAHLAGVIAGITPLPVIGLPIKTSLMGGLDSLLSIVQMPKGVPVACVAVDGAENAAILAIQILSVKNDSLRAKMIEYKQKMKYDIVSDDKKLSDR